MTNSVELMIKHAGAGMFKDEEGTEYVVFTKQQLSACLASAIHAASAMCLTIVEGEGTNDKRVEKIKLASDTVVRDVLRFGGIDK